MPSLESLKTLKTLQVDNKTYHYYSLPDDTRSLGDTDKLPFSMKVLLENLLRFEDGGSPSRSRTSRRSPTGRWTAAPAARSSTARRAC